MASYIIQYDGELYHFGIKGQKWGERNYQNEDGTWTDAGLARRRAYDDGNHGKTFTASNGMKVKGANSRSGTAIRKVISNRNFEKFNTTVNTALLPKSSRKRVQDKIHKESAALREYNAHLKDIKKGTGDKYLNKEIKKNKFDSNLRKVKENSNILDKLTYNDATRKRAAKLMTNNNMTLSEARKKANGEAWRNTAAILGAVGGATVAYYKMANK